MVPVRLLLDRAVPFDRDRIDNSELSRTLEMSFVQGKIRIASTIIAVEEGIVQLAV